MSLDIRTIEYRWTDTDTPEPHYADVFVGDGKTDWEAALSFDERIFFYFDNEAEFRNAFEEGSEDFVIVKVLEP
jgi:hypothetical protein